MTSNRWVRVLVGGGLAAGLGILSGCYVVPANTYPAQPAPGAAMAPAPAMPVVLSARLYPQNEQAAALGAVNATVTNDLHGRGTFNAVIAGESFTGEATRSQRSDRQGVANGVGNRGGYLSCTYQMNNSTQGTGTCRLASGAAFAMHIGQ